MGFVRVRDNETGYHYDLPEGDPRIGNGVTTRLSRYDVADRPRDPKFPTLDLDNSAGTDNNDEES